MKQNAFLLVPGDFPDLIIDSTIDQLQFKMENCYLKPTAKVGKNYLIKISDPSKLQYKIGGGWKFLLS